MRPLRPGSVARPVAVIGAPVIAARESRWAGDRGRRTSVLIDDPVVAGAVVGWVIAIGCPGRSVTLTR